MPIRPSVGQRSDVRLTAQIRPSRVSGSAVRRFGVRLRFEFSGLGSSFIEQGDLAVSFVALMASTRVARSFGHVPSHIDSIALPFSPHRRLFGGRRRTLIDGARLRKTMIRLFLCRFVGSPSCISSRSRSSTSQRARLDRPIHADALASLNDRAQRAILPASVARATDHETLTASFALPLIPAHAPSAHRLPISGLAPRNGHPRRVDAARELRAARADLRDGALFSVPSPLRALPIVAAVTPQRLFSAMGEWIPVISVKMGTHPRRW